MIVDNGALFTWKCHLAFIVPTNSSVWSLSANDKFIEYTKHFNELAITIPTLASATSLSTAVILWGLRERRVDALEAGEDVWENLNLLLIFQGVARSTTDIELLQDFSCVSHDFVMYRSVQKTDDKIVPFKNRTKIPIWKWSPTESCTTKTFIGKNVF